MNLNILSYTNLNAPGEFVVAIDMDGGKFSDFVELKLDLDWLVAAIVSPAYPALGAIVIVVHFEIIRSCSAIRQLTQTTAQLAVPVSIVGRVEEFPSVAPFIALGHRVGHHAVCERKKLRYDIDPFIDGDILPSICSRASCASLNLTDIYEKKYINI